MIPRVVVFDLDETLAHSKVPLSGEMGEALATLLAHVPVAIISGAKFDTFRTQVLEQLPVHTDLSKLLLFPTVGSTMYAYDGAWHDVYAEHIPAEEAEKIQAAIEEAITETGLIDLSVPSHGERIEHRGSQVTLSALGQQAPLTEKLAWDPERTKRPVLHAAIAKRLPEYDVRMGGSTSFDVTRQGINKAFGVRKLSEHLSIPTTDMLYIGDALFPGGNDEVVQETGIVVRETSGPEETLRIIAALLETI